MAAPRSAPRLKRAGTHADARRVNTFVVISGCSGGGKSTLLAELARRGHATMPEPGRRIVEQAMAGDGDALPWVDMAAFARRAIALSLADRDAAAGLPGPVFFDRGLVDAAVALRHVARGDGIDDLIRSHRYHHRVFMAPPWPEIYRADAGRRHAYADAIAEYDRLAIAYPGFGYEIVLLPKLNVEARADFVLAQL